MIPPISSPWEPELWSAELTAAFRQPNALLRALDLPPENPASRQLTGSAKLLAGTLAEPPALAFKTLVPQGFVRRMTPGDRRDPLLLQVLPDAAENHSPPGYVLDPLEETGPAVVPSAGLVQKYSGRALLIATPGCAVHCRYCFRRHFPYAEHRPRHLAAALAHIRKDTSLHEIILSGGDPLLLTDVAFTDLLEELNRIPHIQRIRVHTRLPVVIPERMTQQLMDTLARSRAPVVTVLHCNHSQELDASTARACHLLQQACHSVLNQAVLLQGVNDTAQAQIDLAEKLFQQGVLPYYLHMPDAVLGTAHFHVSLAQAESIYRVMQSKLPGFLLPRLVREEPGKTSKTLLSLT